MPKCELCDREFKSMAALGSHRAYVHKAGGGATPTGIENDSEILEMKKAVRKGELSLRLQRLKEGMDSGQGNLLFLELDRLGRVVESLQKENEALRKDNEAIRSTMLTSDSLGSVRGMVMTLFKSCADNRVHLYELNKLVGQSLVLEGWRLNKDACGIYNLNGLGNQRLAYLMKEGRIVVTQPHSHPSYGY